MATLTQTATKARLVIRYGFLAFVSITILWFTGGAVIHYYKAKNPPPPPPPTVSFGILPKIKFLDEKRRPSMTLELPQESIPVFLDRMTVFSAPTRRSGFLDAEKAITLAGNLGFLFKPEQPTETYYTWRNRDRLNSTLSMDIVTGHYTLNRVWQNDTSLLVSNYLVSDDQVVSTIFNFLQKGGLSPADIAGNKKIKYLKANGGKLVPALSLSDAEFVQVDFFRNSYKVLDENKEKILFEYNFYRPNPDIGLIRSVVSGALEDDKKIITQEYKYTKINYDESGTYPIKTGEQAWGELQQGGGFVASGNNIDGEVKIRRILLGYYDSELEQAYAMPIYVFLGDKGFIAYVSAIKDGWIDKNN